jgi:murein DD-endopeptidase MepM/ murein hydrolase activator NlpD
LVTVADKSGSGGASTGRRSPTISDFMLGSKLQYTILILRAGRTRFRKVHVSAGFLATVLVLAAVALVGALAAPHLALRLQQSAGRAESLARENLALRSEQKRFEETVSHLARRLGQAETQAARLARELGLEGEETVAAGGEASQLPPSTAPLRLDVESLELRTRGLVSSMSRIDDAFQERARLLAATPNVMPVSGWFSHGFGWRKDPWTGEREFHRGIDIVAEAGTDVRATADGFVVRATRQPDYGNMIDLDHGYGYATRYGHLSELLVQEGQAVRRGQVIGRVGSTGRSTGPHLHYEVFRDDRRVNPWKYLGRE